MLNILSDLSQLMKNEINLKNLHQYRPLLKKQDQTSMIINNLTPGFNNYAPCFNRIDFVVIPYIELL